MKLAVKVSAIAALALFFLFLFLGAFYPEQEMLILLAFLALGVTSTFAVQVGIIIPMLKWAKATYFPAPDPQSGQPSADQYDGTEMRRSTSRATKITVFLSVYMAIGLFVVVSFIPASFPEYELLMFFTNLILVTAIGLGFYFGLILPLVRFMKANFPPR